MLRSVSGLVAMLALVAAAHAQDTPRLQRVVGALSSPPSAEELTALGASDANGYVYFVQDFLTDQGIYGGAVDGQLTNATIRAIVGYCRDAGFAETCIRGPLLPQSIAAVAEAVAAALAPAVAEDPVTTAATPAAATPAAETPVEPVEQPVAVAVLPEGWRFNDNGSRGTLGLVVELVSAGPAEAVIHFSGTATRQGYFNIEVGPTLPAAAGTWVTSVDGASQRAANTGGTVWLRTAMLSDDAYLGELFEGIPLQPLMGSAAGSGEAGVEVRRLLPYVQLWAEAGEVIDVTLTLRNPQFTRQ